MSEFRIKNWSRFQHYKSGPHSEKIPEWIKLYRRLLEDIEWHNLADGDAKALVELWILASESGGSLPPLKTISFRLRRSEETLKSILARLTHWVESCLDGVYTESSLEREEEEKEIERADRPPPKRGSQIPEDWQPKSETLVFLKTKKGFQEERIQSELEQFRDHHRSKGSAFRDFDAAFRKWMAKALEFSALGSPPTTARRNGSGWYIKPDSDEYNAWMKYALKISDYSLQGRLKYNTGEIKVASRWPGK